MWTQQAGTPANEYPLGVAAGAFGVSVTGTTEGRFRGEERSGKTDAFVLLVSANGHAIWLRQFGTPGRDTGADLAVAGRRLVVAGWTGGDLARPFLGSKYDAFVRCLTVGGDTRWTRQFGSQQQDRALGVAVTDAGVVVAGRTRGRLPGQTLAGADDAFLRTYSLRGRHRWTDEFGTVRSDGAARVVSDGTSVVVVGFTDAGNLDGVIDIAVWGFSSDGQAGGTLTFGTQYSDYPGGVALLDGHAYVVGTTGGDAFLAEVPLPVGS